jgi:gas vesicle protein
MLICGCLVVVGRSYMSRNRFGLLGFIFGLMIGLISGATIALLLAPLTGAQTRGQIANRATGFRSTVGELIEQARGNIDLALAQLEKVIGLQERNLRKKLNAIRAQLDEYHLNEA